jgi:hypothetical protein
MSTSAALGPRFVPSPSRKRRKRFLAVGVAGLAVLAAALGISFAGDTGTASISVSSASNSFVFPVADGASLPANVNTLKYTTAVNTGAHTITTAVLPTWVPSTNTAGSVTTAGDLALIDGTLSGIANALTVNVYITNLAALQLDYSSFALPFNVYESPCTAGSCTWTQSSAVVVSPPTYLTSTEGFVSFSLPKGKYYDIAIDLGGSFYTISTTASGGSLSPSFYFASQST